MARRREYWAGLMFSAWTTCSNPWRMASVTASPRGSFSSAGLSCWKVRRYFFCCTISRKEWFLPSAVKSARKMGFPPLWSNLRAVTNRTSLSSWKRSRKHNLTQSSCCYPFKTFRPNWCFLLVFTTWGEVVTPWVSSIFSSPPFQTVRNL